MSDIKHSTTTQWNITCLHHISLKFLTKSELLDYSTILGDDKHAFVKNIKQYVSRKYGCLKDELVCMVDGKEVFDDENLVKLYVECNSIRSDNRATTEVNSVCGNVNNVSAINSKIAATSVNAENRKTKNFGSINNFRAQNYEYSDTFCNMKRKTASTLINKENANHCERTTTTIHDNSENMVNIVNRAGTMAELSDESNSAGPNNFGSTEYKNINDIMGNNNYMNNSNNSSTTTLHHNHVHHNTTNTNTTLKMNVMTVKKCFPISVTCLNCTFTRLQNTHVLTFNVSPSDSIGHLKALIERETSINRQTIQIMHNSAPIQDDTNLLHHHILAPPDSDLQKITFNMVGNLDQHRTTFNKVHTVNLRFLRRRRRGRTTAADKIDIEENEIKREEKLLYIPNALSDAESVEAILYGIRKMKALKKSYRMELLLDHKVLDKDSFIRKLDVFKFDCNIFKI